MPRAQLTKSYSKSIGATGMNTEDGEHHGLDVIVCATGFDISNILHYPVTERHGMTLAEKWKDEPEAYLLIACPDFLNYFMFFNPNTIVGHGTLCTSMEWTAQYIIKWPRKVAGEQIRYIAPKQTATDEFNRHGDRIQQTLSWTGSCVG